MIFTYRLGLIVMVTTIVGVYMGCSSSPSGPVSSPGPAGAVTLEMGMTRIEQPGLDPFVVHVTASRNGNPLPGQNLILDVPKGSVSAVTDHGDGTYSFQVTPASTGTYPVTVQIGGSQADSLGLNSDVSLTRKAVVLDANVAGSGQPMAVPGTFVNTAGYEDGITITPDGEYLFVQYGPVYMSGPLYYTQICSSSAYSMGYDLNTCSTRPNSSFIFETVGPYNDQFRPSFPIGGISKEKLLHLSGLVIPGVVNGILAFPTVFYGFKRQADGTFAQPFKLAFDDSKGVNGPFGLSFKMNGDGTGTFVVAWDNYFNNLGDDGADVYTGTITFGRNNSMGQVTYNGDSFASITPTVSPVGFSSHTGVQGNPHLYYDQTGKIKSIWTDDERVSHDLTVYRLTSGSFPSGTWVKTSLPSDINTTADESQPFFTGTRLILRRNSNIVAHTYTPTNGACASGFSHNDCWGAESVLIGANGHTGAGEIATVGEPTLAQHEGRTYLYFAYVEVRSNPNVSLVDLNADAGFVEIP